MSTLSVETSTSGSSTSTLSPTFFSQRVTVPSVTDSPSSGISTGVRRPGRSRRRSRRTSRVRAPAPALASVSDSASSGSSASGSGSGVGLGVRRRCRRRRSSSASPITASSPPTSTVSSSWATIFFSTPAAGDGISVSTLSVDTSSSGSSSSTVSPSCFSQRVTVPSVTLSPSAGIWTEMAIVSWLPCTVGRSRLKCRVPSCHVRRDVSPRTGHHECSGTIEMTLITCALPEGATPGGTVRQASRSASRGAPRPAIRRRICATCSSWVAEHHGVEAFVEPKTTVTDVTVVLVAADGEWTRRRAGGDAGRPAALRPAEDPCLRRAEDRLPAAHARLRRAPADRAQARRARRTRRADRPGTVRS